MNKVVNVESRKPRVVHSVVSSRLRGGSPSMTDKIFPIVRSIGIALVVLSAATISSVSSARAATSKPLNVIEMFTSHGCSSCPPADALLGQLLDQRDDLIALEWHVDYWNTLVHGADGSWVDPFSDAAYTERQRTYASQPLQGRRGVYTPQAIVNGSLAAVGSDSRRINAALDQPLQAARVAVDVTRDDDELSIAVSMVDDAANRQAGTRADTADVVMPEADVWLIRYRNSVTTEITAGENRDLSLTNHHVVTDMQRIGSTADTAARWRVAAPVAAGYGCAVLVQDAMQAPVLGAARCP